MNKKNVALSAVLLVWCFILGFTAGTPTTYITQYKQKVRNLILAIGKAEPGNAALSIENKAKWLTEIRQARLKLKAVDFWLRYLEPQLYRQINGPLPVEWETEVFEKYEKPYRREGAGLTLATILLNDGDTSVFKVNELLTKAKSAAGIYLNDSILNPLNRYDHFYFCNRLFLLNLSTVYTTGFENPEPEEIIKELRVLIKETKELYAAFNSDFPDQSLPDTYLALYNELIHFVEQQPDDYAQFNHYYFIRNYINPLFAINQACIAEYKAVSHSNLDYALNKQAVSIFDKRLYDAQQTKGLFLRVKDTAVLNKIERLGKQLFFDPLLSGNNERSCASCHKPEQYFADTVLPVTLAFDKRAFLSRNAPGLLNAPYNHLIMQDGRHLTLQDQAKAVVTNSLEMNCEEEEMMKKILSCHEYKVTLKELVKHTPAEPEVQPGHIYSALTYYYGNFSNYYSPFDRAMDRKEELDQESIWGFNLFMSKAQCATCHFVPQFNGVKPPYIGSEFEVIGTPADVTYSTLSPDEGRYAVNPAKETHRAFRTATLRNISKTAPYMHNGVFKTLEQVVDFYDGGGGAGRGLLVPNQTLSSDSLHLTSLEKKALIRFMTSLTEAMPELRIPTVLPVSRYKELNKRKIRGSY
ncbi:MAG: cytochrome c peroxidase [Sediminibacterium sp.]|nr:cytochrome c peroxidase [Sediminibacterium sp.]